MNKFKVSTVTLGGGNIKNFAWVPKIVWAPCFNVSLSFKSREKKTSINQGKIYEKNIFEFINKRWEKLLKPWLS